MTVTPSSFIGLDIEATGADLNAGHHMIQLGLAVLRTGEGPVTFTSLIRLPDDAPWDPRAARVHGIPRAHLTTADPVEMVAAQARVFLGDVLGDDCGVVADRTLIPVGFNIAGFDVPFVRRQAPSLAALFSHRTVDLNAPLFALSLSSGRGFNGMKRAAKRWAWEQIGPDGRAHDAGWDALMHLYVFQYLRDHATEFSLSPKAWRTYQRTHPST